MKQVSNLGCEAIEAGGELRDFIFLDGVSKILSY